MPRDVINADALQGSITEALEGLPAVLLPYKTSLQACLRRAAETHGSVRRARRRRSDPGWAHRKFDQGHVLHRFWEGEAAKLFEEVKDTLDALQRVAEAAEGRKGHPARAFLRSLTHERRELWCLEWEAEVVLEMIEAAALRARRDERLRPPMAVTLGTLVATRCASIAEAVALGKEAGNCLSCNEHHHRQLAAGAADLWVLRNGSRVTAVLEVMGGEVTQALGPGNAALGLADAIAVARFARAAGLRLGAGTGLEPHLADPPRLGPVSLAIRGRRALYAEWATAVRIDLGGPEGRVLSLTFDPAQPLARAVRESADPTEAVARFGSKALRRIVARVAMAQAEPTLVQHRLLALAA